MNDWRTVKLADLGPITTGKTPPSGKPDSFGGSIPFVTPSDMLAGRYIWSTSRSLTEAGLRTVSKRMLPAGCVLVSCIGSDMGKTYIASRSCFTNQQINSIEVTDRGAHPLYVYYNLSGRKAELQQLASGSSAQPILNKSNFSQISLELPPIGEQTAIADLLGSLDDKIELNQRMNETLEAMAQAIFGDWFVDFGPTQRKLDGATDPVEIIGGLVSDPDRARELAALFPARLGDEGLPEGWELTTISCVTSMLKRGLAPAYSEGGIPVVNQRCIRGKNVDFSLARQHDVEKRAPKERLLQLGDVLVNSTGVGTLGRVATVRRLPGPATADSHVTICRTDSSKISPLVVSLFLEASEDEIAGMGHGSTGQTELNPAALGSLALVIASHHVQRSFESIVEPLRQRSSSNVEQNRILAATRDLLLPKLMSGEIRLSEAEAVLEAAQ